MERCKKKLSLISFSCKCEKEFCNIHRIPESHNCVFEGKKHIKNKM